MWPQWRSGNTGDDPFFFSAAYFGHTSGSDDTTGVFHELVMAKYLLRRPWRSFPQWTQWNTVKSWRLTFFFFTPDAVSLLGFKHDDSKCKLFTGNCFVLFVGLFVSASLTFEWSSLIFFFWHVFPCRMGSGNQWHWMVRKWVPWIHEFSV